MLNNKRLIMTITAVTLIIIGSAVFLTKRFSRYGVKFQESQGQEAQQGITDSRTTAIIQSYNSLPPEGKKKFDEMLLQLEKQYSAKKPDKSQAVQPVETNFKKQGVKIKWQDAGKYIGKYVVVEGEILSSYNNGDVCFLNFDKDFKKSMSLTIFGYNLGKFHEHPEKYYYEKTISACGTVKQYKDRLEIILTDQNQIAVVK